MSEEPYLIEELRQVRSEMADFRKDLAAHQANLHAEMLAMHEHSHACVAQLREQIRESISTMEQRWSENMTQVKVEIGKLQVKSGLIALVMGALAGLGGVLWKK